MPTAKHHCWTPEELALLGTDTDAAIAVRIGRTPAAVKVMRWKVRPYTLPRWTAEEIALLGTDTDRAVAAKLGRSVPMVGQKRRSLRIPVVPEPQVRAIDMPRPP